MMKHIQKAAILILLCVMLLFTACGQGEDIVISTDSIIISIDSDGNASWNELDGAIEYDVEMYDHDSNLALTACPNEAAFSMPEGHYIKVRAVFKDGTVSEWYTSEFFGQGTSDILPVGNYVNSAFTVKWEDLLTYDILANVNADSIKTLSDGNLYFEAAAPNGGVMRFVGIDTALSDGIITFQPGGRIYALDSIGRICAYEIVIDEPGNENNYVMFSGGYTLNGKTSVESIDELFMAQEMSCDTLSLFGDTSSAIECMDVQPNFICLGEDQISVDSYSASALIIYYDETTFAADITKVYLHNTFYGTYVEGDYYDSSRESFDIYRGIYDFYLAVHVELADEIESKELDPMYDDVMTNAIYGIDDTRYTVGDLKDAEGNVLNKETDALSTGCTIEVTLAGNTVDVELPVLELYDDAQSFNELTPYNNAVSEGEVTALVIPVVWQDQTENATDKLLETIYSQLGRVVSEHGDTTDYSSSNNKSYSLSEYFDTASYGKYAVSSFVTDWYYAPYNFIGDKENTPVLRDTAFIDEIYDWLMKKYPDMDWTKFDIDADGIFDSVIIYNAGDSGQSNFIDMSSYGYAMSISTGYTGECAGTQSHPTFKNFISINTFLDSKNVLIHEYSHTFGLIDYYDVTYSGINAVGEYDMQSNNVGDWNAFSKYAVNWITPEVVKGLNSGESIQLTIGGFAETGDAIVIPAAGTVHKGPFGEYIIIDLLTDGGVNEYDAAEYKLSGKAGVRISHVNANMEKRTLTGTDGVKYTIGTYHNTNAYNMDGIYALEVIQASGKNTFTNLQSLQSTLSEKDLFYAGDEFDVEDYTEFFVNGHMDNGSEFGYTVEIVSIDKDDSGEISATLNITRK